MPAPIALPTTLLILAALGGLLLILRRHRMGRFLQPVFSQPEPSLGFAMQASEAATQSRPSSSSDSPFLPRAKGELILVVDDESSVRDLLCTVLLNHGYQVISAGDGVEGLMLFTERQAEVALIITDLQMPRSTGQTFAELLRAIRPDVRILFMSGLDSSENGEEPRPDRSSDPFLLKPFKPVSLLGAVHKLLHPESPRKT